MNRPGTRVQRRPVHGVLLLDKPLGLSSNQALQKAKWLLRAEKAGHTGTLDPLATGVLPLCFGAATKFSQIHLDADKTYEAGVTFGIRTTTGDVEGDVLQRRDVVHTAGQIDRVLQAFTGRIRQTPPMHSALKKDGKALYEYARAGIEVDREAREIEIFELNWQPASVESSVGAIKLNVKCSKGTYIRTLAEDIGEALGCGAHLGSLRRTQTGPFNVAQCLTLEQLETFSETEREQALLPVDALLTGFRQVTLQPEDAARFLGGLPRRGDWPDADQVAVFAAPHHLLLGSARIQEGQLLPVRLLSQAEVQQIQQSSPPIECAA